VPPSRTIRLVIKNLGVDSLVLKTVKVDVNLNAGPMTRVMLASNDEEVLNINELSYEPDYYYLLNTHLKHAVVNRNNTRYLLLC
jgi:hypothetical protein